MGGVKISVRMRVFEGLERSSLARIWPMNPPAPVMRMCILECLDVIMETLRALGCVKGAVLPNY